MRVANVARLCTFSLLFAAFATEAAALPCNTTTLVEACSFDATGSPAGVSASIQDSGSAVTISILYNGSFELNGALTTDSTITLTLTMQAGYTPAVVMTTGYIESPWTWNSNTRQIAITLKPRSSSWTSPTCLPESCPSPATSDYSVFALLAIDSMSSADSSLATALHTFSVSTNAQYFTPFPSYDSTTKTMSLFLGAPSKKTDNTTANRGFVRMFIPDAFITSNWGVTPALVSGGTTTMTIDTAKTVSSLTRSGSTATATTSTAHGYSTGDKITIAGADQSAYNDTFEITVTGSTTFTFTVSGSPATPATGTITAKLTITPTITAANGGVTFEVADFGYSVPEVAVKPKANTAPTITDISNQSINENSASSALAFTIDDTETAASSLTVSGSSSNTTLVPDANIVFGGSGATRTVTVTPAANQIGTATITVSVSDGSLSTSDTFTLTVNATVNFAPTISDLTQALTIDEDTATSALGMTIGDRETPVANLTLSGSSSNTTLVPNANIVFGGSGSNRTVTITPAANQNGSATITVTVSDGARTASDNLTLTVTAVNDAPTISDIVNQTINEDGTTGGLAFTISDVETAASSLTLSTSSSNTTLVPAANIVLGGSGGSRTVAVTPAANQNGSATITVTVSDGALTASDTFTLTVNAVNDAPTIVGPANQTTGPGVAVGPLAITVNDVESSASQLTLTGASSNTTLVPAANLVLGGSGSARTVTVTPASGSVGTATLTLTVSDGATSASATFTLTVTSTLTLEKTGAGIGTIGTTSDPSRCGANCAAAYQSAESVRLVATPDPQASFAGWSGDDDCLDGVVTMSANRVCRARFTQVPAGGPLDLNSDRIGDVFSYDAPTGNWTEWVATAARTFTATTGGWSPHWVVRAADFNLDNRSDLFLYNPRDGQWFQVVKTDSSYRYINGTWSSGWTPLVADFNADRRSDVFLYNPLDGVWIIAFASADGGFTYSAAGQWSRQWEIYPVEYNADGLTDLFLYNAESGRWFWVVNAGQGPGVPTSGRTDADLYVPGSWSPGWHVLPADFNGDRRTDFLLYNRTTGVWVQARNTTSGFQSVSGTWDPQWSIQAGDFNGDTRDDLLLYNESTGAWVEALVDANGAFSYHGGTWDAGWRVVPTASMTDGRIGLFLYNPTMGTWVRATPTGPGTFSYVSGTFGAGLSLVVTNPRVW